MDTLQPQTECQAIDSIFGALGVFESLLDGQEAPVGDRQTDVRQKPWILHVDDDRELAAAMAARLNAYDVEIVNAFDGTAGVRTALSHQASAIILDYEMPNGQGDYVLGRLKDNPITRSIPVFVLTGRKDGHLERKMLAMGAEEFFNKPVQFGKLLDAMRKHLDI